MHAIVLQQSEITSINARVDKSIRFSVVTGELRDDERAKFFPLQGINVRILIEPNDVEADSTTEVTSKIDNKTPSQRQRSLLFLIWKASGSVGDFNSYYASRLEKMLERLKEELHSLES